MTADLESRLERVAEVWHPSEAARERARAGALAALPHAPRSRVRFRVSLAGVAAAVVVAAVALVTLLAPWEGASPFSTERALAAIGDQPVLHAVVEYERPWATIVDLGTGQERSQTQRTELLHDDERGALRLRHTVDGILLAESVQTRQGSSPPPLDGPAELYVDPALTGFATRYRAALESGEARIVAETTVDGRDAVRLEITAPNDPARKDVTEEVDVDADTYRPLRFRFVRSGEPSAWGLVVAIETLPRSEDQFAPPPPGPPTLQTQTESVEREVTPAEAARALDRTAVWPGRVVDGIELSTLDVVSLTTGWTDGRETEARSLWLRYGGDPWDPASRWLEIAEGTVPESVLRWPREVAAPPGSIQLFLQAAVYGSSPDLWAGYLELDGVFVKLKSPERDVVLAAARALAPIPEGG